jgi:type VI secretion system protein VasG
MVNVDLRQLLGKLNFYCTNTLNNAAGLCVSRTNYEVTVEHWLIKCLESRDGDLAVLLDNNQEIISLLMKELNQSLDSNAGGNGGKPSFSPRLTDLLSDAWLIASVDLGLAQIRSGAVILAILEHPMVYGQEGWFKALKTLNSEKLKANFATYTAKSVESITPTAQDGVAADGSEKKGASANGGFIERFCQDFTKKAAEGKLDPVFGRDNEIRQMVDILARRRKNNPILVGEPGVGKTAVLEGLALRIVEGDVPEILKDVQLIGLDMGLLEAGAGVKGEFENRLKGVIQEIQSSTRPIILFIDEAHTLIGAGGSAGTSDAANLLKPALARGELKTCAATTWSEYKKYFEKDPALARRFQLVKLAEPSVDTTALILRGLKASYEKSHKVVIRDDSLQTAAEYADRYITARFLPDKAIDLVDTACARVKVNLKAMPGSVEDLRRKSQALKRQISSLQRDIDNDVAVDADKLANLEAELKANDISFEEANANWQKELEAVNAVVEARAKLHEARSQANKELSEGEEAIDLDEALANVKEKSEALAKIQGKDPLIHYEVTPDLIAQVVSDWTGIPLGRMARDELSTVLKLDEILQTKVKGQNVGIKTLTTVIRNAKSGLKNPEQPLGVFLLVGPSGVGKTETAINLAEQLFGSERSLITINMSEYQEKHTVSRLVGSPPGYVGYGEGGVLTEAVRQQPYSVVLLDEVEKAHPDILNIFYQVFDKGVLSDGEGKEINFANTVILLTSNLATDVISELSQDADCTSEAITEAIRPILNNHFKPALLARMTVVPYRSLNQEALHAITILKLGKLVKLLAKNNGIELTYENNVVDQIVERCHDAETGARNIDLIINVNLLPKLSAFVLAAMSEGVVPKGINLKLDDNSEFDMEIKQ